MEQDIEVQGWLQKALESLATAASEVANGRYNSAANRCYYACFQAAIVALLQAGIRTTNPCGEWGHDFVQAEFAKLIRRQKAYPSELAGELTRLFALRRRADYQPAQVSHSQVERALARTRRFVETIEKGGVRQ